VAGKNPAQDLASRQPGGELEFKRHGTDKSIWGNKTGVVGRKKVPRKAMDPRRGWETCQNGPKAAKRGGGSGAGVNKKRIRITSRRLNAE